MKQIDPDLIRREPAAALLGISVRHLVRLTTEGKIPQPFRFGPNCVLYSKSELLAHLAANTSAKITA